MNHPFRNLSRPKALGLAGVAAGVLAVSSGAAAMNVGLLSTHQSEPFTPQPVSVTEDLPTTTTTESPEIVYEDVYEHVTAPTPPPAVNPVTDVAPTPPAPSASDSDDDHSGPSVGGYESDDDHEMDAPDDEHESEHESEHEDGGEDD